MLRIHPRKILNRPLITSCIYICSLASTFAVSHKTTQPYSIGPGGGEGTRPLAWQFLRDSSTRLYAIIVRQGVEPPPGSPNDGALYFSGDAAEHWTKVTLAPSVNETNGIALEHTYHGRLYLAAWGRYTQSGEQGGDIYVSQDRGQSRVRTSIPDNHIFDITVDELASNIVYAMGFESAPWKSTDSELTWNRIAGYNFKWGQRVTIEPANRSKIYTSTFGGGVWHLLANTETTPSKAILPARNSILVPTLSFPFSNLKHRNGESE